MTFRGRFVVGALLVVTAIALGKGEYNSKYLYTQPDPADTGAIRLQLSSPERPTRCVAYARRSGDAYLGALATAPDGAYRVTWEHLPTDVYDLLIVGDASYYEGLRLARRAEADAAEKRADDIAAVTKEMMGIEAFFDAKQVERLELEGEFAHLLVQQWRVGEALAESGAVLQGSIHSIDVFRFQKPAAGWQSPSRRQLYREEIPQRGPLAHVYAEDLGGFRVTGRAVERSVTVGAPAPAAP